MLTSEYCGAGKSRVLPWGWNEQNVCEQGEVDWHMGWLEWRQHRLPLIGFEAACGGHTPCGERARIVVLNALGDTGLRHLALLLQDIPRSCKLDSQLNYVDVPRAPLELAAGQVAEQVGRVPDLAALGRLVREAQLSAGAVRLAAVTDGAA